MNAFSYTGKVIGKGFRLFFKSLLYCIPFMVLVGLIEAVTEQLNVALNTGPEPQILLIASMFVLFIVAAFFYSCWWVAIFQLNENHRLNYLQVLGQVTRRFIPYIGSTLLLILGYIILLLIVLLSYALVMYLVFGYQSFDAMFMYSADASMGVIVFQNVLAFVTFCFIMFFVLRFFFYWLYILGLNKGPIEGIEASWDLTRGAIFKTFLLIIMLLVLVITFALIMAATVGVASTALEMSVVHLVIYTLVMLLFHHLSACWFIAHFQGLRNLHGVLAESAVSEKPVKPVE